MRKAVLLCLVLLLLPAIRAIEINSYDLEAALGKSSAHEQLLVFATYQGEDSIELLLPPSIKNMQVSINDAPVKCSQREIPGATKIVCPLSVRGDYFAKVGFETSFPLVSLNNKEKLFSQKFSFARPVRKFAFRLKLPERAVLPEEASRFVNPEPDRLYSDGRRIILSYEALNVTNFDVSVIYEPPKETSVAFLLAIFFLILIVVGLALFKIAGKPKTKKEQEKREKPLYLLPDEKTIVKILKESGEPVRQRDIEKQVAFSKAKLSRVLRSLEERGIIKRTPRGNTNLIELIG